jgi:hypothetical protein
MKEASRSQLISGRERSSVVQGSSRNSPGPVFHLGPYSYYNDNSGEITIPSMSDELSEHARWAATAHPDAVGHTDPIRKNVTRAPPAGQTCRRRRAMWRLPSAVTVERKTKDERARWTQQARGRRTTRRGLGIHDDRPVSQVLGVQHWAIGRQSTVHGGALTPPVYLASASH